MISRSCYSQVMSKTDVKIVTAESYSALIRECAQIANLPRLVNPETGMTRGISPHRLRDAFAVHAVKTNDSGDGLRLLQEHLGHVSFNTTAKYRKVSGAEHRDWYQKLWREANP